MRRSWLSVTGALVTLAVLSLTVPVQGIGFGTADTTHTYVGAWVRQNPDGSFGWCSGELVSARVFLTAGHCVQFFLSQGATPATTWVTFDADIFPPGVTPPSTTPGFVPGFTPPAPGWLAVSTFLTDPQYNPAYMGTSLDPHDLGVVILRKAMTSVGYAIPAPVGLLDHLQKGALAQVSVSLLGYGWDENGQATAQRRISSAPILGVAPQWLYLQVTNAATGSGGINNGDSGGPELLALGGTEYLVATNTLSDGLFTTGVDAGYRLDTASAQSFIQSEIAANP